MYGKELKIEFSVQCLFQDPTLISNVTNYEPYDNLTKIRGEIHWPEDYQAREEDKNLNNAVLGYVSITRFCYFVLMRCYAAFNIFLFFCLAVLREIMRYCYSLGIGIVVVNVIVVVIVVAAVVVIVVVVVIAMLMQKL